MYLQDLWRYPIKSMAGERLEETEIDELGLVNDRKVLVRGANGRVITAGTHPRLLSLKGTFGAEGVPKISGHRWDSIEGRSRAHGCRSRRGVILL